MRLTTSRLISKNTRSHCLSLIRGVLFILLYIYCHYPTRIARPAPPVGLSGSTNTQKSDQIRKVPSELHRQAVTVDFVMTMMRRNMTGEAARSLNPTACRPVTRCCQFCKMRVRQGLLWLRRGGSGLKALRPPRLCKERPAPPSPPQVAGL